MSQNNPGWQQLRPKMEVVEAQRQHLPPNTWNKRAFQDCKAGQGVTLYAHLIWLAGHSRTSGKHINIQHTHAHTPVRLYMCVCVKESGREKQASCCTICKSELRTNMHLSLVPLLAKHLWNGSKTTSKRWHLVSAQSEGGFHPETPTYGLCFGRDSRRQYTFWFLFSASKRDLTRNYIETGVT